MKKFLAISLLLLSGSALGRGAESPTDGMYYGAALSYSMFSLQASTNLTYGNRAGLAYSIPGVAGGAGSVVNDSLVLQPGPYSGSCYDQACLLSTGSYSTVGKDKAAKALRGDYSEVIGKLLVGYSSITDDGAFFAVEVLGGRSWYDVRGSKSASKQVLGRGWISDGERYSTDVIATGAASAAQRYSVNPGYEKAFPGSLSTNGTYVYARHERKSIVRADVVNGASAAAAAIKAQVISPGSAWNDKSIWLGKGNKSKASTSLSRDYTAEIRVLLGMSLPGTPAIGYASLGYGIDRYKLSVSEVHADNDVASVVEKKWLPGFRIGAGVRFKFGRVSVFGEYYHVSSNSWTPTYDLESLGVDRASGSKERSWMVKRGGTSFTPSEDVIQFGVLF